MNFMTSRASVLDVVAGSSGSKPALSPIVSVPPCRGVCAPALAAVG